MFDALLIIALIIGGSSFISFKLSNGIIKPLRELNMKMMDIIADGMKHDLEEDSNSSVEI